MECGSDGGGVDLLFCFISSPPSPLAFIAHLTRRPRMAPGARIVFRITNSSYEYVKWLNGENEVKNTEGGWETNENVHRPAILSAVYFIIIFFF